MVHHKFLLLSFVITLTAVQGIHAVYYDVTDTAANTTGGSRFNNEIGSTCIQQANTEKRYKFHMGNLPAKTNADRKNLAKVSLFIEDIDGVAYAVNNEIHEMTHIWQWNGNGQSPPGGLIEGIPDFVRLKSGYVPSHWVQPGKVDRWDQGYDVTARFLDYLNGLRNGFVADLNKKLRTGYLLITMLSCLGRLLISSDYKAKYGN
nr:basic secretory protease [Quercus suber]